MFTKLSKLDFANADKRLAYKQLMRMDKPIGTLLLLWPTFWALWWAAEGTPSLLVIVIFTLGVFLMRSAGCVINDFADRELDGHVERTQHRPLAAKRVSEGEALSLFALLVGFAFICVLFLNWQTIALSVVALLLASIYPFMKRFTYLPQFVLGAAFSWAIPMAFMAIQVELPTWLWLIYLMNLLWTVAYDTMYAMVDRDDDLKIGIKSTAILFGRFDKLSVGLMQFSVFALMMVLGLLSQMQGFYYLACLVVAILFVRQQMLIADREKAKCFQAFLNNNYVGLVLFVGIAADYFLQS
ncbi:4-hydroxybenzoate octaprenyltransferase [Catenovulum sp. SM1970]|uniref:4-hydroxybenzoate octaprenyltransferase n=1 Tax=Marinifaba aquimaris TaxID=2741323 RepID=UPI00157299D0|nr:4-hydroxybenzoate octaprenyltransferase [Marinifaba aquimaris]NTS76531.1 4-hydroxybenzoate octaprenyltransferase [Marinifaba aquimaris]